MFYFEANILDTNKIETYIGGSGTHMSSEFVSKRFDKIWLKVLSRTHASHSAPNSQQINVRRESGLRPDASGGRREQPLRLPPGAVTARRLDCQSRPQLFANAGWP